MEGDMITNSSTPLSGSSQLFRLFSWSGLLLASLVLTGCNALNPVRGVPASYLPTEFEGPSRGGKKTINLGMLTRRPPDQHRVAAGDVLSIYVPGVLGRQSSEVREFGIDPPINFPQGEDDPPTIGFPFTVRDDHTVSLPQIPPINVHNMTLHQVEQRIRRAYTEEHDVIQDEEAMVLVSLQRPRVHRVLVVRQETSNDLSTNSGAGSVNIGYSKRGTARTVTLKAYENDVMHALALAEGADGLPGLDAKNTIYIIRRRNQHAAAGPQPQFAPMNYSTSQISVEPEANGIRTISDSNIVMVGHQIPSASTPSRSTLQSYRSSSSGIQTAGHSMPSSPIASARPQSRIPSGHAIGSSRPVVKPSRSMGHSMTQSTRSSAQSMPNSMPNNMRNSMQNTTWNPAPHSMPVNSRAAMATNARPTQSSRTTKTPTMHHASLSQNPFQQSRVNPIQHTTQPLPTPAPMMAPNVSPQNMNAHNRAPMNASPYGQPMAPSNGYPQPTIAPAPMQNMSVHNMPAQSMPVQSMAPQNMPRAMNSQPYSAPLPSEMMRPQPTMVSSPYNEGSFSAGGHSSWGSVLDNFDPTVESPNVVKIPIRLADGEMPHLSEEDVTLYDGDIVFIESRETEVFYTGGLLGGGQYTLPRDYDLHILEALSIAEGRNSSGAQNSQSIGGVSALNHDVSNSASRVVILRNLPNGQRISIEVDLPKAMRYQQENILVQPGDMLILQYTVPEAVAAFTQRFLLEGALIGIATSTFTGGGGGG